MESGARPARTSWMRTLSEVSLITKDAFEPSLPLSVVVHIDYQQAPLVIQRFGDVKRLVEQTLDPMVSAYFKNVGQTRTLIQLIQERSVIQSSRARRCGKVCALQPGVGGSADRHAASPTAMFKIEQILTQLRSRQIAEEQIETYNRQEKAAVKERELREAESARASSRQHDRIGDRASPFRATRARPIPARHFSRLPPFAHWRRPKPRRPRGWVLPSDRD